MAKIHLPHLVVFQNCARLAVGDYFTIAQNISAMANSEGFADIMVRDQDADIEADQVLDAFLDIKHRYRVDPGERFVEQDK